MKRIVLTVVVLFMALAIAGNSEAGGKKKAANPGKPAYWKIDSVDAANFTFTTSKVVNLGDKKDDSSSPRKPEPPQKYSTTAFTKIIIAGKPGKLEDLKPGMKVSVNASGGGVATRVDAEEAPPAPAK